MVAVPWDRYGSGAMGQIYMVAVPWDRYGSGAMGQVW